MDEERYAAEGKEAKIAEIRAKDPTKEGVTDDKINYRMIQPWDVPKWIDAKANDIDEDALLAAEYGLGKRKRGEVNYRDEMSDNKWLQIVDAGGDPEVENERIRKRRKDGLPSEASDDDLVKSKESYAEGAEP